MGRALGRASDAWPFPKPERYDSPESEPASAPEPASTLRLLLEEPSPFAADAEAALFPFPDMIDMLVLFDGSFRRFTQCVRHL